jgi:hypothetical protein
MEYISHQPYKSSTNPAQYFFLADNQRIDWYSTHNQ